MNTMNALRYAADLRTGDNRHLGYAFGISIVLHLALIGLYSLVVVSDVADITPFSSVAPRGTVLEMIDVQATGPAGDRSSQAAEHPGEQALSVEGRSVPDAAGTPVIADLLDSADVAVASLGGLAMLPSGLETISPSGLGGTSRSLSPSEGAKRREPSSDAALPPDEFVEVQEPPRFDAAALARAVQYPEMARRSHIEGTVVVRVLIDRNGRPLKTLVDHSDQVVLDDAARAAVMSIVYTPAIQNQIPVPVWIQVPVAFRLQ